MEDDNEEFDWEIEQSPYEEVSEGALHPQCRYGFGNLRSGVFQRLQVCCPSKRPRHIGFLRLDNLISLVLILGHFYEDRGGELFSAHSAAPCIGICSLPSPRLFYPSLLRRQV